MNHDQAMQRSCVEFLDINKMMDKDQIDAFIKIQKRNILKNVKKMIDKNNEMDIETDIYDVLEFVEQEFHYKNSIFDFYFYEIDCEDKMDKIFYKMNKDKLEELFNYAGNESQKCFEDMEEMIEIML